MDIRRQILEFNDRRRPRLRWTLFMALYAIILLVFALWCALMAAASVITTFWHPNTPAVVYYSSTVAFGVAALSNLAGSRHAFVAGGRPGPVPQGTRRLWLIGAASALLGSLLLFGVP